MSTDVKRLVLIIFGATFLIGGSGLFFMEGVMGIVVMTVIATAVAVATLIAILWMLFKGISLSTSSVSIAEDELVGELKDMIKDAKKAEIKALLKSQL